MTSEGRHYRFGPNFSYPRILLLPQSNSVQILVIWLERQKSYRVEGETPVLHQPKKPKKPSMNRVKVNF